MKLRNEIEVLRLKEYESDENLEKMKEFQSILEQEQFKSQKFYQQLLETQEILSEKNEEIRKLKQNDLISKSNKQSPNKINIPDNKLIIKEMKLSVDSIIESLSKPNDSKNLLKVSKDLLNLQEFLAVNLKGSDDKIMVLLAEKQNNDIGKSNSNKKHKHSPSSNMDVQQVQTEPSEFKGSNFNIYKLSSNY